MTNKLLACGALSFCLQGSPVENAALDTSRVLDLRHNPVGIDANIRNLAGCMMNASTSDGGVRPCNNRAMSGWWFHQMESVNW